MDYLIKKAWKWIQKRSVSKFHGDLKPNNRQLTAQRRRRTREGEERTRPQRETTAKLYNFVERLNNQKRLR